MAEFETLSEQDRWLAQLPERSCLLPSEAEAGTLDEGLTQDNELGAHRPQDPDAVIALAAEPARAAPPVQVAGNNESAKPKGSELRVKEDLEGNGLVAATRSANASLEADSQPSTGDVEQAGARQP